MTFDNVLSWALKAKPGEQLVYHKGKQLTNVQNKHDYSDAVWGARYCYNGGLVELFQRRDGSQFFYIAMRKRVIEAPEKAYAYNCGARVDRFAIPYRYYRNSCHAHEIDGKWTGSEVDEAA